MLMDRLRKVRLVASDVDGVLTRGGITWGVDAQGGLLELRTFHSRDGLAVGLARAAGLQVAWISGRRSAAVESRAAELRVPHLLQAVHDKEAALRALAAELALDPAGVLYLGDDLNDLPAWDAAGVRVAVADAAPLFRARADWVTTAPGGTGAFREVVDRVLDAQGLSGMAEQRFLSELRERATA